MTLTLQIENFHVLDDGGPVNILVPQTGIQVGRRTGMNWVLPDASRYISGHHFDVRHENGHWILQDSSTNGTFLQGHRHRLDGPHVLKHGDRFQVGQYVIVALMDQPQGGAAMTPGSLPSHPVERPVHERESEDPWALGSAGAAPIDIFPVEQVRRGADFADDFVAFPDQPKPAPPAAQTPAPMVAPFAPKSRPAASLPPQSGPSPSAFARALTHPPVSLSQPAPDPQRFVRAFCEGAGLSSDLADAQASEKVARELGRALRTVTEQLMGALQERAAARHFTRSAERTMRGAADNNPLKFLPDAAQALEAMFLRPRAGFSSGAASFDEALGDLRRHQTAIFAALQPALLGLIVDLDPGRIEDGAKGNALMGGKKAKAWDVYVERWDAKTASENGILDEFIRLFAQAYRKAHDPDAQS